MNVWFTGTRWVSRLLITWRFSSLWNLNSCLSSFYTNQNNSAALSWCFDNKLLTLSKYTITVIKLFHYFKIPTHYQGTYFRVNMFLFIPFIISTIINFVWIHYEMLHRLKNSVTCHWRQFLRMDSELIAWIIKGNFGTDNLTWLPNDVGNERSDMYISWLGGADVFQPSV